MISVKGDAYTRGGEYGSKASVLIRRNVDYYLYLWKNYSGLDRESALNRAGEFASAIEEYDHEILEEIQGIADGAGLSLEEVLVLNARYEFVYTKMVGECTAIAAIPEATVSNHTLIGQNWDYKPGVKETCVLLRIEQSEGPDIIMHVEAGIIGHKGMNSAGIGICVNALCSDQDRFEPKVPVWVVCRKILNAENLDDAIETAISAERSISWNCMMAHADGRAINLELTPSGVGFINPDNGVIAHTNHFIDPNCARDLTDRIKARSPNTVIRLSRALDLLSQERGSIGVESFKRVFRDHSKEPNSICRHRDPELDIDKQVETLASVIMDLDDRVLYITDGPPCGSEYKAIFL